MEIEGYVPRESQKEMFASPARFMAVDAGRRWGKTVTGLNWLLDGVCKEGGVSWWIAPVYSQSRMAFRKLLSAAKAGNGEGAFSSVSHGELRMVFINGASIEFKSADNPDNLRGEGLSRVVIDEAARVRREVFEEVVRPAVSDTGGRILFISTPKGRNWFYDIWTKGQDGLQPDYKSWKFPTADNPKVGPDDIAQAQQSLPQDVFNQEYMAEFLEDSAGVFRNIDRCIGSVEAEPNGGGGYYAGCDLAKHTDFTVLTILDGNGNQVYFNRIQKLDWVYQKQLIMESTKRYNAQLLLDSTGIGDPIFDDLRGAGLAVDGYKFTSESKKKLIESLMLGFEQMGLRILNNPVQTNELKIFEYEIGQSGTIKYSAPEGYHDDCVIALALAWWAKQNSFVPMIWRVT